MISTYNIAVEYEHLKKYEESLECYKKAAELAKSMNRKNIETDSQEGKERVEKTIGQNRKKLMELLQKKKENQERGNYESMCRNKKNIKNPGESSLLQMKLRKYDLYM